MTLPPTLIIFAKAPIPGRVKTRLIPTYGKHQSTRLYQAAFAHVLQEALKTNFPIEIHISSKNSCFFSTKLKRQGLSVKKQSAGDLGRKMRRAGLSTGNRRHIIVGADCIGVTSEQLIALNDALSTTKTAFIGAEDGGYVAVGTHGKTPELFKNMPWGSSKVLAHTKAKAHRLGLDIEIVGISWDLDRPTDVRRAKRLGFL